MSDPIHRSNMLLFLQSEAARFEKFAQDPRYCAHWGRLHEVVSVLEKAAKLEIERCRLSGEVTLTSSWQTMPTVYNVSARACVKEILSFYGHNVDLHPFVRELIELPDYLRVFVSSLLSGDLEDFTINTMHRQNGRPIDWLQKIMRWSLGEPQPEPNHAVR